jgi:peptide/nickel transport system permease protein
VSSLIWSHLPPTLWLLGYAVVLTVLISVPLAVLAASRRDGIRDHVVRAVPLVGLGMPQFWLGFLLIYGFAISLRIFPVSGYGSGITGHLQSMFLPGLTVAFALTPVVIRSLRASMLNVLTAEYIVTARSKGVPPHRLFLRHVLRNAVIPAVTVLAINIGFLIGATVIIEQIFAVPGIGQLMINSIFQRDFPVVQGVTLVFGVMVVLVNLLADLSYAALDPRVRFDR